MDKRQLGPEHLQQQVTYERALEGQLAQTIETIDGESSAQVDLVLPNSQDQLFSDQQQPSTASVLLSGSSSLQSGFGAWDRAAGRLQRPRPAGRQGDDHRL